MNTHNNLETYIFYLDEKKKKEEEWRKSLGYSLIPRQRRPLRRRLGIKTFRDTAEFKPKKDGIYITFFERGGQKSEEVKWLNGKIIGDYKKWYNNGNLSLQISFKNGLRDGLQKSYYSNGNPKYEDTYRKGKKNGTVKDWSENGNLKSLKTFKDDIKDGVTQSYYTNGNLKEEIHFKNGEYEKSINLDVNGNLLNGIIINEGADYKNVSTYKDGIELNCIYKEYSRGKLYREVHYKFGKMDGTCKEWNVWDDKTKSYHLESEEIYKNGKLNGECKYYERYEGKLESIKNYKDGKLISEKDMKLALMMQKLENKIPMLSEMLLKYSKLDSSDTKIMVNKLLTNGDLISEAISLFKIPCKLFTSNGIPKQKNIVVGHKVNLHIIYLLALIAKDIFENEIEIYINYQTIDDVGEDVAKTVVFGSMITSNMKIANLSKPISLDNIISLNMGEIDWYWFSDRFPNENHQEDGESYIINKSNFHENDYNNESFGKYQGSYTQDNEGLSDNFIDDALDGDPDNYWNID